MTEWFSFRNAQEQFEGVRGNDIKTILQTLKFSKGLSRWQIKKKKKRKEGSWIDHKSRKLKEKSEISNLQAEDERKILMIKRH